MEHTQTRFTVGDFFPRQSGRTLFDLTDDLDQGQLVELLHDLWHRGTPVTRAALKKWRRDRGLPVD